MVKCTRKQIRKLKTALIWKRYETHLREILQRPAEVRTTPLAADQPEQLARRLRAHAESQHIQ
jgi:hypothetical protein